MIKKREMTEIKRHFAELDIDQNGRISAEELYNGLKGQKIVDNGVELTLQKCQELTDAGQLTLTEFAERTVSHQLLIC